MVSRQHPVSCRTSVYLLVATSAVHLQLPNISCRLQINTWPSTLSMPVGLSSNYLTSATGGQHVNICRLSDYPIIHYRPIITLINISCSLPIKQRNARHDVHDNTTKQQQVWFSHVSKRIWQLWLAVAWHQSQLSWIWILYFWILAVDFGMRYVWQCRYQ